MHNLTTNGSQLDNFYVAKHKTSLSKLVEEYFKTLTRPRPARKANIIDFMKKMPKPKGKAPQGDLNKLYYEDNKKKYGF